MGLFDFLKKRQKKINKQVDYMQPSSPFRAGKAYSEKIKVDILNVDGIRRKYIAFDVETTGLNPSLDRIIEVGAVLFEEGIQTKSFSTRVNPKVRISPSASAINNITNDMIKSAPNEQEVYSQLVKFLGDALDGETIMCAHNASFDFSFLNNTFSRLGYDAKIKYVDTLSLSRKYIKGIVNYKQETLEKYFGLKNAAAHSAKSDAEICGKILNSVLDIMEESWQEQKKKIEKMVPDKHELEVCAFIQNIIMRKGGEVRWIRYRKNSNNYVDVTCLYTFLKFKFAKKGSYIIVRNEAANEINLPVEPCTVSEGGTTNVRIYFTCPFDLEPLSNYIYAAYSDSYNSMKEYISLSDYFRNEAEQSMNILKAISNSDMEDLLLDAKNKEYDYTGISLNIEQVISREDVVIDGHHNRVPLNKIRNIGDWEKGFDLGYPYWERGEAARKSGKIDEAIFLFDKARYNGYDAPVLYDSYAKAYRKNKDYDNEILILEEGILRKTNHDIGTLEARRNKAIKLLFAKQEANKMAKEKADLRMPNKKESDTIVFGKKRGRQILQMTDDGTIIKEFETIASAVREVGVNSKSIRDAANGVQKHAGGYCWKFKD
ncbi:exonuclease domain-containing protein [Granulicatella seriolae]|uniref:Exonuclease domain-containing protein n=1 Tax=Granulicatella seriolae TaxID=2967226 RepID=A0ABT1WQT5_9LACT|nr:exonuclease domain-containing protein [Granulicatella seriolae]